ncbi:hypothetical protein [Chthonobacter rhizosphaerae]|uniref:hypothetical protein n=1 Tax=Chthonobacter rhizosphaerae TaxID=2735553 RepID=UPI0015EE9790|nr:hypothetical protein [Chthonobacter rhizosphaerae]
MTGPGARLEAPEVIRRGPFRCAMRYEQSCGPVSKFQIEAVLPDPEMAHFRPSCAEDGGRLSGPPRRRIDCPDGGICPLSHLPAIYAHCREECCCIQKPFGLPFLKSNAARSVPEVFV